MKEQLIDWNNIVIPWLMSHGVKIVFIVIGAYVVKAVAKKFIEKTIRIAVVSNSHLSKEAERQREDTLISIFTWIINVIVLLASGLMVLQEVGVNIGPLLAGAGVVGLAVGFGGQYLIRDVISGFFIILENQYRIGDVVNFEGTRGLVENISLRMTTLRDLDGTVHHVPHGEIKKVANLSKYFSRVNLDIGISYNSKLEHVIEVINKVGNDLSIDPQWKEFIIKPPQFLRVNDLADSAIIIKILGETKPLKQWEIAGELRKRINLLTKKE
jgi:moderate conductance mechanosensitive channel